MSDEYGISATIGADDSGFQATFDNVEKSLNEWGLDFDKLYEKGDEVFSKFGINIDQFASKLGATGPMLTAVSGVGVAVVEVGEKVLDVGKEFEEAGSSIGKTTGATGDALKNLNTDFQDLMSSGIAQNITDVAAGFATLSQKLDLSGEPLKELTKSFAEFADVNETSVKDSVDSVTEVINKWNISAEETPDLLDQLTKASQLSGASVTELSSILKSSGSVLQNLGLSLTDSISLFGAFEKDGVNTQTVIAGLRTALTNYTAAGKDATTALQETFDQIKNAETPTEALTTAIATFGTKAGSEMVTAIQSGKVSIEDFEASIKTANGTVAKTGEETETLADKMSSFGNKIKSAIEPLGSILVDLASIVTDVLSTAFSILKEVVSPILDAIKTQFDDMKTRFQNFVNLITDIVHGDWKKAWTDAELLVLNMAKGVLDGLSGMVNSAIGIINGLITAADAVLDKVHLHINTIAKVSLSDATGLTAEIKRLNQELETTDTKTVNLGATAKKTAATAKTDSAELSDFMAKLRDSTLTDEIDKINAERDAKLKEAEKLKASAQELAEINTIYDDKVTAVRMANLDKVLKENEESVALYKENEIKKQEAALTSAENVTASDKQLSEKNKDYSAQTTAKIIADLKTQENAEVALATLKGVNSQEIAAIQEKYSNEVTQVATDNAKKQQELGLTLHDAIANYFDNLKEKAKSWNDAVNSIADSISSTMSSALEDMGSALAGNEDAWNNLAKTALDGLAQVLKAIGQQLAALAVVDLVTLQWGSAAAAAAGSAAAFVAAGAISAWADAYAATGSDYTMAGTYLVGEQGPELLQVPQGSKILNNSETVNSGNSSKTNNLTFNISAGQNVSAAEIARQLKRTSRQLAFQGVL